MNIKLVIFDFDGTIADTRKAIVVSKQEAMRLMGLPVADEETCASTIGLSAKLGFQQLYPGLTEERVDQCVAAYRRIFEEKKLSIPPTLFPGVEKVLSSLRDRGMMLAIASSRNTASLTEFLGQMNLSGYFPYFLGGDDTPLLKPNPDPVLKTLEDLSFRPEDTLVVGDMPFDIEMGKRAGAFACGVTYGNASRAQLLESGADFTVDSMEELLTMV